MNLIAYITSIFHSVGDYTCDTKPKESVVLNIPEMCVCVWGGLSDVTHSLSIFRYFPFTFDVAHCRLMNLTAFIVLINQS